jgi:hypothetical protein
MARRASEDPALDERDLRLLAALLHARVLSTAQLAQALPGEQLGRLVERLKRLAIAGWLGCVAHVPTGNGRVTVWFRTDQPPPGDRVGFAEQVLPLGALYAGLCNGPRAFSFSVATEGLSRATIEIAGPRRFVLVPVRDEAALQAACDALAGTMETAPPDQAAAEVLLLAAVTSPRQRLQAIVRAWRTRHPESRLAPHVTSGPDALRVLRTLVHGELLALDRPGPPVAANATP